MDDNQLVEEYLRRKGLLDQEQADAQQRADNMKMGAGVVEGLGGLVANSGPGVTYLKGWNETGSPQRSNGQVHKPNMGDLRALANNTEQRADAAHRDGLSGFTQEQSLADLGNRRRREQEAEDSANAVDGPEADSYRSLFAKHFPGMDVSQMSVKEMKGVLDPAMKSAGMDESKSHNAAQLEIAKQKANQAGAPPPLKAPSDKMVGEINSYTNALGMIKSIRAEKGGQDTGPISNMQNSAARMFGVDDPSKSAFRAKVQTQLAQYIRDMSGTAASDKERDFLEENTPTVNDNDETFNKKLDNIEWLANQKQGNLVTTLEDSNRDVSKIKARMGQAPQPPGAQQFQKSAPPSGKVHVSNGTEDLYIDPSDLQDAINDGYKQVQ